MAITRVNSRDILDRTIRNVDIHDNAEIADTKLATISTTGKVANSATTGTYSATPNTLVLRDGSGNANFNAVHAVQSITSDTLIRSQFIEAQTSISLLGDDRTTSPVSITRNIGGAGIMSGLEYLYVNDTIFTSTLEAVNVLATTGRVETAPVNGTDIANKDYVDAVATAGSITGDLTAGRVVLSTGLHTVSDSGNFTYDSAAKTCVVKFEAGPFPNVTGISIDGTLTGTVGVYADDFIVYAQSTDATAFQVSCPGNNVSIGFFGATPVWRQPLTDGSTSMLRRIANGLANFGLFSFGTPGNIIPTKVEEGGTGLGELGAAFEVLRVNASRTALEYSSAGSGDVSGTFTAGRVPYAVGDHALKTSADLLFDLVTSTLTVAGPVLASNLFESDYNVAVGSSALNREYSYPNISENVAIGPNALSSLTFAHNNIAIGNESLTSLGLGNGNIAIGTYSQRSLVTGNSNIAIGTGSQSTATSATFCIGIGNDTQSNLTTGSLGNIAIGYRSQYFVTTGDGNVALGNNSQNKGTTGNYNVCIGHETGYTTGATPSNTNALTSGSYNTFVGTNAGFNTSTQRTNSTALGYRAYVDADNTVALGNAAVTTIMAGSTGAARVIAGMLSLIGVQGSYANNASAISGGLTAGQVYTVAGSDPRVLAIVF